MNAMDLLATHPVFRALDPEALTVMADGSTILQLRAREVLYRFGDPADRVFMLASGLMRVFQVAPDGREATITHLLPPNAFSDNTVLAEDAGSPLRGYPENTMALKPSTLVAIPAETYVRVVRRSPGMVFELLRDVCTRFNHAAFREVDVMLPVRVRLASMLLAYAEAAGTSEAGGLKVRIALTHKDLGASLGVATKSIARALDELSNAGLIARRKGWFLIKDADRLRALCGRGLLSHVYRYDPRPTL